MVEPSSQGTRICLLDPHGGAFESRYKNWKVRVTYRINRPQVYSSIPITCNSSVGVGRSMGGGDLAILVLDVEGVITSPSDKFVRTFPCRPESSGGRYDLLHDPVPQCEWSSLDPSVVVPRDALLVVEVA